MARIINIDEMNRRREEGSGVLNISIDTLIDNQVGRNSVRDTLYTAYVQAKEENLHELLPQHFITKALNRLFNSHLKENVIKTTIKLYSDFLDDEASDLLLQYAMHAFYNESAQLVATCLEVYFRNADLRKMSSEEQVTYCLHVLNVLSPSVKNENKHELSGFISFVTSNLFYLSENAGKPVQRTAIWALYLIKEWEYKSKTVLQFNENRLAVWYELLKADFDSNTKFRICVILIRDSHVSIPDTSDHFALEIAKKAYKQAGTMPPAIESNQTIPILIENTLIELMDAPNRYWVNSISVPVLAIYASHKATDKLLEVFRNQPQSRSKAGTILFTKGKLSVPDLDSFKSVFDELDHWIISMSGHLIHTLKTTDTTGKMAYFYILVEPDHENEYNRFLTGDKSIVFSEHGRIIASCYGDEPTQEVKNLLKKRYGYFA